MRLEGIETSGLPGSRPGWHVTESPWGSGLGGDVTDRGSGHCTVRDRASMQPRGYEVGGKVGSPARAEASVLPSHWPPARGFGPRP